MYLRGVLKTLLNSSTKEIRESRYKKKEVEVANRDKGDGTKRSEDDKGKIESVTENSRPRQDKEVVLHTPDH